MQRIRLPKLTTFGYFVFNFPIVQCVLLGSRLDDSQQLGGIFTAGGQVLPSHPPPPPAQTSPSFSLCQLINIFHPKLELCVSVA